MSYLRDWIELANPPGSRHDERATRVGRPDRCVPPLQRVFGFLRRFAPIVGLPFLGTVVTKYDDVQEVLARDDVFGVPFGEEIARLNDGEAPGTPFILGIDDRDAHAKQLAAVMRVFKRADIPARVTDLCAEKARAIVAGCGGRLEAIGGLVTRIPLEVCKSYYGVAMDDPRQVEAAIAVSGHLFGIPPIEPKDAVDRQAAMVREAVDRALDAALVHRSGRDTIADRLCDLVSEGTLTRKEARAFLIGMIVGFVPTNTIAGGNILEMLLRRRKFLAAAREAAHAGDDDLLAHVLFEALRFMPINFGPFRRCKRDFILADGTARAKTIRAGDFVLASTMSAMFDRDAVERPYRFVPGRPAANLLHFGFGMHWCVGAFIARAQMAQTFKPLVMREELERAGKLRRTFPLIGFPKSLPVRFKP